jgi:hypothetical protein
VGRRKAERRAAGGFRSLEAVLDTALDKAITIQRPVVLAYLDRVRKRRPDATPAEVVTQLERRYLAAVVGIGGASGAAATLPGAGTVASVVSGAAEITAFVSSTASFVLALAELHGVPVSDPEVRRALVIATLLGDAASAALDLGEHVSPHWALALGRSLTRERVGPVNSRLAQLLLRRWGTRQSALLVGRALPLGLGAGVGAVGNAALGRAAIAASRRAFGPAPKTFPARVIDA